MKLKDFILILFFLSFINITVTAQEKQKSSLFKEKSDKNLVENVDSLRLIVDSLRSELLYRDSITNANAKLIESIKQNAKQDSMRITERMSAKSAIL